MKNETSKLTVIVFIALLLLIQAAPRERLTDFKNLAGEVLLSIIPQRG